MSIQVDFFSVVVRRLSIEEPYPGGWEAFLQREAPLFRNTKWDADLFIHSSMNQFDLALALSKWEKWRFKLIFRRKGQESWNNVCVVASGSGPTLPCTWIAYCADNNTVTLHEAHRMSAKV